MTVKNGDEIKLKEALTKRLASLSDLHGRGIVKGELLGRQLLKLLSSSDARKLYTLTIEPDSRAHRILYRLENPEGWRRKSGLNRDERLAEFLKDLEGITDSDHPPGEKLDMMLRISSLPFFKGFVASKSASRADPGKTPSRVSVMD